jgi:hypothetical protein
VGDWSHPVKTRWGPEKQQADATHGNLAITEIKDYIVDQSLSPLERTLREDSSVGHLLGGAAVIDYE